MLYLVLLVLQYPPAVQECPGGRCPLNRPRPALVLPTPQWPPAIPEMPKDVLPGWPNGLGPKAPCPVPKGFKWGWLPSVGWGFVEEGIKLPPQPKDA